MTVAKYLQKESPKEFEGNLKRLRAKLLDLLMRDFGVKPRRYTIELIGEIYQITEEDAQVLKEMSEKYGMNSAKVDKYPKWLVEKWRDKSYDYVRGIEECIESANSIYMSKDCYEQEYAERRMWWTRGIGYCNRLRGICREIYDTIDASKTNLTEVMDMLDKEKNLIKGLRSSDKKILTRYREQQGNR